VFVNLKTPNPMLDKIDQVVDNLMDNKWFRMFMITGLIVTAIMSIFGIMILSLIINEY